MLPSFQQLFSSTPSHTADYCLIPASKNLKKKNMGDQLQQSIETYNFIGVILLCRDCALAYLLFMFHAFSRNAGKIFLYAYPVEEAEIQSNDSCLLGVL